MWDFLLKVPEIIYNLLPESMRGVLGCLIVLLIILWLIAMILGAIREILSWFWKTTDIVSQLEAIGKQIETLRHVLSNHNFEVLRAIRIQSESRPGEREELPPPDAASKADADKD